MSAPMLFRAALLGIGLLVATIQPSVADTRLPASVVIARNGLAADGIFLAAIDTPASGPCWTARLYQGRGNSWIGVAEGAGPARPRQGSCSPVTAVLAADGKTLAVHAVWDDIVYIYDRDAARLALATAITLQGIRSQQFPPPTPSLAISADGDTLLVGAANFDCTFAVPQEACGTAIIYGRTAQGWSNLAKFPRPDGAGIVQRYGEAIAMDARGRTLAIGGTGLLGEPGHLHIYHAIEGDMELVATLRPATADSFFGTDVAMSDDGQVLAVGGDQKVYLYARDGDRWAATPTIVEEVGPRIGTFGGALALSGDGRTLLVGAPRSFCKDGPPRCGLIYRYALGRSGKAVSVGEGSLVEPSPSIPLADFGWRIATDQRGRTVVVQGQGPTILGP